MAVQFIPVDLEDRPAAIALGESTLRYLLQEHGVPLDVQAKLFEQGIRTVRTFVNLEDTKVDIRAVLRQDIGLDSAYSLEQRVWVSSVITAWEVGKHRTTVEDRARAEATVSNLPRPMATSDVSAMRLSYEALHQGRLKAHEVPSKSLLALRMEMVEENEPKALSYKEIGSGEVAEDEFLASSIGAAGDLRIKRRSHDVPLPQTPEEYRAILKIYGHSWAFVALKHGNRPWLDPLRGGSMAIWDSLAEHILGRHIHGLEATSNDKVVARPSWVQIMSYEFELRKRAYRFINDDSKDILEAFKSAIADPETRQNHFTVPLGLTLMGAAASGQPRQVYDNRPPVSAQWDGSGGGNGGSAREARGGGRGGGRGNDNRGRGGRGGGGRGTRDAAGLFLTTPFDGRPICQRYNLGEACDGSCGEVHICRKCTGKHPLTECRDKDKAPKADRDTGGKGKRGGRGGGKGKRQAPY